MEPLFYTPLIERGHSAFVLDEQESKHAVRVLRLSAGSEVGLVDGKGTRYRARIVDPHPKRTVLEVVETIAEPGHPYYLHIAIAPTKNMERTEWFLEKATEIGVDEITPIICERSERKDVKLERLEKIVVAAMKQSLKARLPIINAPIKYERFINQLHTGDKCIAHCATGDKKYLKDIVTKGGSSLLLIGPEGDFSDVEINQALNQRFVATSLGTSRLRTETAALAGCMEIAFINR